MAGVRSGSELVGVRWGRSYFFLFHILLKRVFLVR